MRELVHAIEAEIRRKAQQLEALRAAHAVIAGKAADGGEGASRRREQRQGFGTGASGKTAAEGLTDAAAAMDAMGATLDASLVSSDKGGAPAPVVRGRGRPRGRPSAASVKRSRARGPMSDEHRKRISAGIRAAWRRRNAKRATGR